MSTVVYASFEIHKSHPITHLLKRSRYDKRLFKIERICYCLIETSTTIDYTKNCYFLLEIYFDELKGNFQGCYNMLLNILKGMKMNCGTTYFLSPTALVYKDTKSYYCGRGAFRKVSKKEDCCFENKLCGPVPLVTIERIIQMRDTYENTVKNDILNLRCLRNEVRKNGVFNKGSINSEIKAPSNCMVKKTNRDKNFNVISVANFAEIETMTVRMSNFDTGLTDRSKYCIVSIIENLLINYCPKQLPAFFSELSSDAERYVDNILVDDGKKLRRIVRHWTSWNILCDFYHFRKKYTTSKASLNLLKEIINQLHHQSFNLVSIAPQPTVCIDKFRKEISDKQCDIYLDRKENDHGDVTQCKLPFVTTFLNDKLYFEKHSSSFSVSEPKSYQNCEHSHIIRGDYTLFQSSYLLLNEVLADIQEASMNYALEIYGYFLEDTELISEQMINCCSVSKLASYVTLDILFYDYAMLTLTKDLSSDINSYFLESIIGTVIATQEFHSVLRSIANDFYSLDNYTLVNGSIELIQNYTLSCGLSNVSEFDNVFHQLTSDVLLDELALKATNEILEAENILPKEL